MYEVSRHPARIKTVYVLIAMNAVLLIVTGFLLQAGWHLQHRVERAEQRSYVGCIRGNVLREIARYAMRSLGSPERAARPEVQEQDCAQLYPGGKR